MNFCNRFGCISDPPSRIEVAATGSMAKASRMHWHAFDVVNIQLSADEEEGFKLYIMIPFDVALEHRIVTLGQENPMNLEKAARALPFEALMKCHWAVFGGPSSFLGDSILFPRRMLHEVHTAGNWVGISTYVHRSETISQDVVTAEDSNRYKHWRNQKYGGLSALKVRCIAANVARVFPNELNS